MPLVYIRFSQAPEIHYFNTPISLTNVAACTIYLESPKSTIGTATAAVEVNNNTYCLQDRIEKFPLENLATFSLVCCIQFLLWTPIIIAKLFQITITVICDLNRKVVV